MVFLRHTAINDPARLKHFIVCICDEILLGKSEPFTNPPVTCRDPMELLLGEAHVAQEIDSYRRNHKPIY